MSIDERMVRSNARFSFKQYIRNKPTKWGFKLWCLCDAHNGYTVHFSVYRGWTSELQSGNGLSYDVVMNLLEGYLDQGYSIYVDNFYTSPTLGSHLFDRSTHITGTLDRTRVGVPDEVKDLWANMSHRATTRGSGGYVRVGTLVYAVWKDTKRIIVMSTSHPGHSMNTVLRNCKDSDGKRQKIPVPIPEPVYQYNRYMGGVTNSSNTIMF